MLDSPKECWFRSKSQTWTWTPLLTFQAREPNNVGVAKEEKTMLIYVLSIKDL
jgi:hypothetical protein